MIQTEHQENETAGIAWWETGRVCHRHSIALVEHHQWTMPPQLGDLSREKHDDDDQNDLLSTGN